MGKKDDKDREQPHQHVGSVVAEDDELTLWVNRLWARSEPPERIEVWQLFGREKRDRGEMIFHEDFKPGEKRDIEQNNKLANEMLEAAQNDCDSVPKRRESLYQIAVIDRNRRASPLTRRIGPFYPKRNTSLARAGAADDGDTDEEEITIRSLELTRLKTSFEESRYDKARNDRILGEALMLIGELLREERSRTQQLMTSHMDFFNRVQEAEDRKAQREIALESERFKYGLMKDGWRAARNLLPGLFGGESAAPVAQNTNGSSNGEQVAKTYGASRERALIDNFLNDCEESNISIALFGNFEDKDGKLVQTAPGIFSPQQFSVLWGVRDGRLPVEALDPLMPKSGHKIAITEEQIKKALDAGVTEGIGMALFELVGLRRQAQEARASAENESTTSNEPSTQA